ncbi:MAG: hypothetical protein A2170_15445 [Deltaproteobacteria bacterium RBG_13_53_10]|nr:MAG: hypothetical protein A2170_15445 [Deltaproteobacteria bacterium RBG_13_53_10]
MQIPYYVAFILAVSIAIFAVQNSAAPLITIKFLIWNFETSLIYLILGSIGVGIVFTLLIWIPRSIRSAIRRKKAIKEMP